MVLYCDIITFKMSFIYQMLIYHLLTSYKLSNSKCFTNIKQFNTYVL